MAKGSADRTPGIARLSALAVAALLAVAAPPAAAVAVDYQVVPELSEVQFIYTENGVEKTGTFRSFAGGGTLDPAALDRARLDIAVESDSISLGNTLVDSFAQSAEWFAADRYPEVRFRLGELRSMGEHRYLARGTLSIRGRENAVAAPVQLEFGDGEVRATGDLTVDRRNYGLGLGPSAAFVEIGPVVTVRFALTARPAQ